MARLYRKHKRTASKIDVMEHAGASANKNHSGGIMIKLFSKWNPETGSAPNDPDHYIHMTEAEACELISALAGALKS